ncbi:MAG: TA system VapC family ribonuclease toxin [Betaproteobacteria bacterium]
MRALLDVNVLIALFDADHSLHARATAWFAANARSKWATCPITQNGCVRIMSHPAYPNALPGHSILDRLAGAAASPHHEFWPDDISLADTKTCDSTRIHGPRQITDLYLLALAVRHQGRLVTFDTGVALDAIKGAEKKHLLVL